MKYMYYTCTIVCNTAAISCVGCYFCIRQNLIYCFTSTPASSETCCLNYHYWNDISTFNGCSTVGLLSIHSVWMMNNDDPPAHKSSKWLKRNNKSGFPGPTVVDSDLYKTCFSSLLLSATQLQYLNWLMYNVLISLLSECLDIFSGVPPLKQFLTFTLEAVTLPVVNTTLMVALLSLQLTSEMEPFYNCEETWVYTYTCVSHQLVVSVEWVRLWEEATRWPLVDIWLLMERETSGTVIIVSF